MNKPLIIVIFLIILFLVLRFLNIKVKENYYTNSLSNLKINNNDGYKLEILHKNPNIILIKDFLSFDECDHIIKVGDPLVKKSEVCGKMGSRPDKSRTSWTAHIGKKLITKDYQDKVLLNIYDKAARFCNQNVKNIEPVQLVRYKPGQYFKSHYDYLDTRLPLYKNNVEKNGQRLVTFFVYLNNVEDGVGGATYFKKINKTFKASKGQAIFWYNMIDGKVDTQTLHSGTEIKKGTKYGMNIWVRNKEYKG